MIDPRHYYNKIVRRYLRELKYAINNAKSERERNYYQNRFDVQLECFARALNITSEQLKDMIFTLK